MSFSTDTCAVFAERAPPVRPEVAMIRVVMIAAAVKRMGSMD
jgi:hypothetical protein